MGGIKSLATLNNSAPTISKDQIQILRTWNNAVKHGCINQETFNKIIANADDNTKLYFAGLNKGKGSIKGLAKSTNTMSFSAKAGQAVLTGLSIAGNMVAGWLLTKAVEVVTEELYKFIHASEIARDKSAKLTDNWTEESASINDSINKYDMLSAKLNDTSLSASEVKSVKEELIEVQKALTDKYGQEALGIDLVNGKYEEQIAKLKQLSKQKAQDYVVANYSNIQEDQKYVTEKVNLNAGLGFYGSMARPNDYSDVGFNLEKYLKRYDKLEVKVVEAAGQYGLNGEFKLITSGTREETYNQISQLFHDLNEDFGKSNEHVNQFKNTLLNILEESFDTEQLEKSKSNIIKYAEAEILSYDNTRNLYEDAINSVEKYNEALRSGKGIETAKKNLDSVKQKFTTAASDISGSSAVIDNVYKNINKTAEVAYTVSNAFENNDTVKKYAEQLKGLSSDDLLKIDFNDSIQSPGEAAFKALMDIIGISKAEVQTLIDKLVELGYVKGEIVKNLDNNPISFSSIISNANVDNYQEKRSSLESYLEKFRSGAFSPFDKNSLLIDFGIVADSAEEAAEKIRKRMDKETNAIVTDLKEILNGDNISEATRKKVEALVQSLEDGNRAAQNLSNINLTNNALADVQSLSEGLDQLDKIYADILDKEDFDWSSILNNEGFTKTFGAYTDEYNNFIETVTSSSDNINACQEAFNNLASAYIHGSGVLNEVTQATKASCIAMLEQMGVANAAAVVEQALAKNEEVRKYAEEAVAAATSDMSGKTEHASKKLLEQANVSVTARKALFELVSQQIIFANHDLRLHEKITGLKQLAAAYMGVKKAAVFQEAFDRNMALNASGARHGKKELSTEEVFQKTMDQVFDDVFPQVQEVKMSYTGGATTKDTVKNLANDVGTTDNSQKEQTAQEFDWIEVKLNTLNDSAAKARDKIDDLLSFGAKKKQTQKAIEETTKAIEAQYKAIKQYNAYADIDSEKTAGKMSAAATKELTESASDASKVVTSTVSGVMSEVADTSVGVVNDALQYVGKLPYVWGGASLTTGADCSGFVQQLYKKYGVDLVRVAQDQYHQALGTKITDRQDLQPGDLVFFGDNVNSIHHVGIYAGNDTYIDEPNSRIGYAAKRQFSSRGDFVGGKRYTGISSASSTPSTTALPSQKYQKTWTSIPEDIKKNIREGTFRIASITDEGLKAGIASYQEWWNKVKACKDKIEELNKTLKELYQTMANLPLEKRDQKAGNIEQRISLIDATRENVDDVIVSRKKYRKTKKEVRTARKDVRKGLRTKQQKASSGLGKEEREELDSYMKSGTEIPDRLLNSILDSDLYETCREYNDAVSNHAQYAKVPLTAKASMKKYNSLTKKAISAERSKEKVYKKAYKETSRNYAKSLDKVSASGANVKKAVQNGQSGLTKPKSDKILSYIKAGKLIPSSLFAQIDQTSSFAKICRDYNKQVLNKNASSEALKNAKLDYRKQAQDTKQQVRSRKIERQQNAADKIQSKMDRNDALAENESNPKKKNKYLDKNISLTKKSYRHLIRIAKLEGDSAEVEKLKAERKKAIIDLKAEKFQNYADDASSRIERNDALIDNARSASEKNKYLKENISLIQKEYDWRIKIAKLRGDDVEAEKLEAEKQKELNETFRQQYQNHADEHTANMDYLQLKQENATDANSKNVFEQARRDELRKKYSNLRMAAFDDPQEQLRLDEELQTELNKSYKTAFDNISHYYNSLASLIANNVSDIDNERKKIEASGRKIDASFYQTQISYEEKKLSYYEQEETSLKEQLANQRIGTDEWYDCQDALQGVQNAAAESLAVIKQYKDEINAIADAIQEDILQGFHAITDEADLLITLLGDNLTDDKEGIFTDDGLAALSLYVTQFNVCRTATDSIRKNVDTMQKAIDSSQLSFFDANGVKREYASIDEMKEKLQDMYASYREEVRHTYDYESKIIGLMKEKYQAQADWLKDLIDKKKEALQAEKDLYEYSKTIKQQTESIDSLRKQIAALKGDTSKENIARVQKLQSQLTDAEKELTDTEYDRYISDQQNMLDNLYNEYTALLTDLEKDTDRLLQEGLDLFAQTGSDVQDTIQDAANQYNYQLSSHMDNITTAIQGMGSMETYLGTEGVVTKTLSEIALTIKNVYTALSSKVEDADTSNIGQSEEHKTDKPFVIPPYTEPIKSFHENHDAFGKEDKHPSVFDTSTESKPGGIDLGELKLARKSKKAIKKLLESGTKEYNGKGSSLNNYIYKTYGTALTVSEMAKLAQSLGLYYTVADLSDSNQNNHKYKKKILDELKALGLSKGGVISRGKVLEDYGLRNASGGSDKFPVILTEGERVLTPVQNTMWEKWTANMPNLMNLTPAIDTLSHMPKPQAKTAASAVKVEYGNVSINLPNVQNYQDFMRQAQKDPDFNKMIDYMIGSHMNGHGGFGKFNVRF